MEQLRTDRMEHDILIEMKQVYEHKRDEKFVWQGLFLGCWSTLLVTILLTVTSLNTISILVSIPMGIFGFLCIYLVTWCYIRDRVIVNFLRRYFN